MNILLTASFHNGIFCNGLQQNIIFLAELLKEINFNPIIAINHKIDDCVDPPTDILIIEENEIKDHAEDIHAILQTAWCPSKSDIDLIKLKNKSCKNIHIHYGNRLLADIEQSSWKNISIEKYKVDEIWVSPHYSFSIPYFKSFYNSQKVFELPYIWSPKYIKMHEKIWNKGGKSCFYSKDKPKNIGILEPNLNITKHCLPSILIVEDLYHNNKDIFNQLNVYCTSRLNNANYFKSFMWQLDIQKSNKVKYLNREKVSKIFSHDISIVLSHQLLNGLNYTYLESLYFNIPLVHNSEYIKGAGYFYPDYNTQKGASALKEAILYHDQNLDEYNKQSQIIINQFSPKNPFVIEKYKKLLS